MCVCVGPGINKDNYILNLDSDWLAKQSSIHTLIERDIEICSPTGEFRVLDDLNH